MPTPRAPRGPPHPSGTSPALSYDRLSQLYTLHGAFCIFVWMRMCAFIFSARRWSCSDLVYDAGTLRRVNARPPPRRRVSALAWRAPHGMLRHACHPWLRVIRLAHCGTVVLCLLATSAGNHPRLHSTRRKALTVRVKGNWPRQRSEVWAQFKTSAEYHPLV